MPKYTLIIIVALGVTFYFARTIVFEPAIEAKEQITESVEEVEPVESVDEVVASEVVEEERTKPECENPH